MSGKIGLLFATDIEAESFVNGLSLSSITMKPFYIYNSGNIYLIISGIGKAYAAMAASFLIREYGTDIIFNIGAAGSTTLEIRLGDIFHIDKVVEYDRPPLFKKEIRILKPDIISGFKTGSLATQDKPVIAAGHRLEMSKFADLVDMEGAAVVQACRLFGAKSYLYKYVTDTPEDEETDIVDNIKIFGPEMLDLFKNKILKNFFK